MNDPTVRFPWRRLMVALVFVFAALWLGAAWWSAKEITHPTRARLQDYHQAILRTPGNHGMTISAFRLADATPVLLCRPQPDPHFGDRGTKLRQQLAARHLPLAAGGTENGATLVLLHGRRGRKEDNLPIAERFCAAGFRCILLDLPAHGDHPRIRATYGLEEAALPLQALQQTADHFHFQPGPSGLWGISMGGSVAVHAAAINPSPWKALVVVASFDALEPVIRRQCDQRVSPWFGPAFFATLSPFIAWQSSHSLSEIQPARHASLIHIPTLIAHGDDDPVIPSQAARRLFDALASPQKKWINVGSGTHGNVLITPHPLYADMTQWLLRHLNP
jgi:alpha-beta hydrolase superfamily lysophospholipase